MPTDHRLPPSIKAEHQGLLDRLTSLEIEAAMSVCDELGLEAFLAAGNFSMPKVWAVRKNESTRYPAKATVAMAMRHLSDGPKLSSKEFFSGYGVSA